MGADFCLATLPAIRLTDERLGELLTLIKAQEVNEDAEADDDRLYFRDAAYECIQSLRSIIKGNEIETITMDGADHYLWVTGGMSSGEPPTDAYEPFINTSEFEPVWQKMLGWSRADFKELGAEKMLSIVCNGDS